MENGQLTPFYLRDAHLTQEERGNHLCTQRQMIRYLDPQGNPVVEVFQYLRADGTLGASGMPDPKRLWLNNEILIAERRAQPRSSREETTQPS